ncbi:calcium-binding protein [Streptomyces sp. NPDC055287]
MRIRATVAAVSGALALSALTVPAAQADEKPDLSRSPFSANAPADDTIGDTKITKVVVNGGKDIVLGTTAKKTISISVTATDPEGIYDGYAFLWHGSNVESDVDGALIPEAAEGDCTTVNATTSTCKVSITIDPQVDLWKNALAGTWKVYAGAVGNDGDLYTRDAYKTHRVQRFSKLTANASPEPVVKGKTITITGKLSRANWETSTYAGYTNQPVKLQFRKAGTSTYTTVKTVTSNSTGNLKSTVTAASDGYWRYSFAGTSTTPAVSAAGDYLDVR